MSLGGNNSGIGVGGPGYGISGSNVNNGLNNNNSTGIKGLGGMNNNNLQQQQQMMSHVVLPPGSNPSGNGSGYGISGYPNNSGYGSGSSWDVIFSQQQQNVEIGSSQQQINQGLIYSNMNVGLNNSSSNSYQDVNSGVYWGGSYYSGYDYGSQQNPGQNMFYGTPTVPFQQQLNFYNAFQLQQQQIHHGGVIPD
jgi:hypothetical protein